MPRRIEYEGHEDATALALAEQAASDAWPGIFGGGKMIVATAKFRQGHSDVLQFVFDDGSQMNIVGDFEVRYKKGFTETHLHAGQLALSIDPPEGA